MGKAESTVSPVQRIDQRRQCTVLLFSRTIKYRVATWPEGARIGRGSFQPHSVLYPTKTPVFPTDSTLQYHKSNTLALINSLNAELDSALHTRIPDVHMITIWIMLHSVLFWSQE